MHTLPCAAVDVVLWEAEWVSAMLTVGVCRAAAIESFEGPIAETVTLVNGRKHVLYRFISLYVNIYIYIYI